MLIQRYSDVDEFIEDRLKTGRSLYVLSDDNVIHV